MGGAVPCTSRIDPIDGKRRDENEEWSSEVGMVTEFNAGTRIATLDRRVTPLQDVDDPVSRRWTYATWTVDERWMNTRRLGTTEKVLWRTL